MNREVAETVMKEIEIIVSSFNRLSEVTMNIDDELARKSIRSALGRMIFALDTEVIKLVAKEYPDLDIVGSR